MAQGRASEAKTSPPLQIPHVVEKSAVARVSWVDP
jgi:hypothetical protein